MEIQFKVDSLGLEIIASKDESKVTINGEIVDMANFRSELTKLSYLLKKRYRYGRSYKYSESEVNDIRDKRSKLKSMLGLPTDAVLDDLVIFAIESIGIHGYQGIIDAVDSRIRDIESQTGLVNLIFDERSLPEWISDQIFPSYFGIESEIVNKLTEVITKELPERFCEYHECDLNSYADKIIFREGFNPHKYTLTHEVSNIKCKLDTYLDVDLIDIRIIPSSGIASTTFGEIARVCTKMIYRWFNDGDSGWDPCDGCFKDHVNLVEMIRDLSNNDYRKLISSIREIMVNNLEWPAYIDDIIESSYQFDMEYLNPECSAIGGMIIYSALIKIAQDELIERNLATKETPLKELPYHKLEFLNFKPGFDTRSEVYNSRFKPIKRSYWDW